MKNKILVISLVVLFINSCKPHSNATEVFISKISDSYLIIYKFKGKLHPASPLDLLRNKTYTDSILLKMPAHNGTINFNEITTPFAYFNFTKGNIVISTDSVSINLFSTNEGYPANEPFYGNGKYKLNWQ